MPESDARSVCEELTRACTCVVSARIRRGLSGDSSMRSDGLSFDADHTKKGLWSLWHHREVCRAPPISIKRSRSKTSRHVVLKRSPVRRVPPGAAGEFSSSPGSALAFHLRVAAVTRKRPRSFCEKCRWQVWAKHMRVASNKVTLLSGAWLYGLYRTCTETTAVSRGTNYVTIKQCCGHFGGYSERVV